MVAENVEASVVPDDVLAAQAKRYRDLFEMYLRNADTIDRVTFWGVTDATSWLNEYPMRGRTDYPLFFDKDGRAKPCVKAVEKLACEWKSTVAAPKASGVKSALFKSFRIEGKDDLSACDPTRQYRNPIIDGMAPDP